MVRRKVFCALRLAAVAASILSVAPRWAIAADLRPETIAAWDEYVRVVKGRTQKHVATGATFLSADEIPGEPARLRAGEIIVAPAGPQVPLRVPQGLIHDWAGAAFIPNVTLGDVLRILSDYQRYKLFYRPHVLDSELITREPSEDRFSMLIMNRSVISKTALRGTYRSSYKRLDAQRFCAVTEATQIQEVANYGTPSEHLLPDEEGMGLIWRLYSVTRLEERDGGVYMDLEVVALSRDIPASVRWFVEPIVRQVSRSSLAVSLLQTESAVRSGATSVAGTSSAADCPARVSCYATPSLSSSRHSFRLIARQ
jgi:hypothetical protein